LGCGEPELDLEPEERKLVERVERLAAAAREGEVPSGQGRRRAMPVYVRAADSDTWHWGPQLLSVPVDACPDWRAFRTDRPRRDLCKECRRKERTGNCHSV
jgi:hypothetical protein